MKATFPHMGNVYIAAKAFLEELGQEVILPPRCSRRTLELGSKYSSETICLPLKIMIGNFIESIEKGADTILITGSCGPCRFGFYPSIEEAILKDAGYDVEFIVYEPIGEGIDKLKDNIFRTLNVSNMLDLLKAARLAWKLIHKADYITDLANETRAYAVDSLQVDQIMGIYYREVEKVFGRKEMVDLMNASIERLNRVERKKGYTPIRIGLIGEIYTLIEPFVNFEIEKELGHMGVLVEKSLTPTAWLEHHVSNFPFGSRAENKKYRLARPYLPTLVGGHGRETVGSAINYAKEGFDGAIQLLPLNCMPEIVAKPILTTISKDFKFPIMTLILDEMTGEAGFLTRLEAFVDLLEQRREENLVG